MADEVVVPAAEPVVDTPAAEPTTLTGEQVVTDPPAEAPAAEPTALTEEPKAPEGAPEAYEAFTLPEGTVMDESVLTKASELFKGLGLTQAQAQKLVDYQVDFEKASVEKAQEEFTAMNEKWVEAAKTDKDMGGVNWDATLADSRRAIKAFGDDGLKEFLDVTGGGNHPSLIRTFAKIGKLVGEDGMVKGSAPPPDVKPEHIMYPTMKKA